MGSKANPAAIGAFVLGAIALAVLGIVVFGSGQLFKKTTKAVCFFSGDINGLSVGAPVKFKGVEVGTVSDIRLRLKGETSNLTAEAVAAGIRIPVVIQLDNERLIEEGAKSLLDDGRLKQLIDLGLRAQLVSQSLVTGLLLVQLDFYPQTPPTFILPPDSDLLEIPTVPTIVQQVQSAAETIMRKLENVKFDELVRTAQEALAGVRDVVNQPGLKRALEELPQTEAELRAAVASVRQLVGNVNTAQGPVFESLRSTSEKAGAAMESAQMVLSRLDGLTGPQAPLVVDLTTSLREIASAARSLRLLTDYLERHPSAVLRGRYEGEEK